MYANGEYGYFFEDLDLGMAATYTKRIAFQDIEQFATVSGDTNPVHLDADFAERSMFKERIAHGMLTASFISTVLGTKLPGPGCIYLSQNLRFKRPVHIGDEVVTTAKVTGLDSSKGRVTLHCDSSVGDNSVLEGEAVVVVPFRP